MTPTLRRLLKAERLKHGDEFLTGEGFKLWH